MIFPCSDRALLHSEAEKVPAIAAQRHILAKHILPTITPTPVDTFPSVSGGFAGKKPPRSGNSGRAFLLYCVETYVILGLRPFSDPSVAERR